MLRGSGHGNGQGSRRVTLCSPGRARDVDLPLLCKEIFYAPRRRGRAVIASPLWKNRDYMLLWGGQVISTLGSTALSVVYPLLILAITDSAAAAGIASGLRSLPYLIFSLPVGALIDRWNRKRVMILVRLRPRARRAERAGRAVARRADDRADLRGGVRRGQPVRLLQHRGGRRVAAPRSGPSVAAGGGAERGGIRRGAHHRPLDRDPPLPDDRAGAPRFSSTRFPTSFPPSRCC